MSIGAEHSQARLALRPFCIDAVGYAGRILGIVKALAVCRRERNRVVFFPLTSPRKEFEAHYALLDRRNG